MLRNWQEPLFDKLKLKSALWILEFSGEKSESPGGYRQTGKISKLFVELAHFPFNFTSKVDIFSEKLRKTIKRSEIKRNIQKHGYFREKKKNFEN